jgi:hypothetical protein
MIATLNREPLNQARRRSSLIHIDATAPASRQNQVDHFIDPQVRHGRGLLSLKCGLKNPFGFGRVFVRKDPGSGKRSV